MKIHFRPKSDEIVEKDKGRTKVKPIDLIEVIRKYIPWSKPCLISNCTKRRKILIGKRKKEENRKDRA